MTFEITANVRVTYDGEGQVVHLSHVQEPYRASSLSRPTTTELADAYARDVVGLYGVDAIAVRTGEPPTAEPELGAGTELRLEQERHLRGSATVSYRQTHDGLPIWDATLQVHLSDDDPRVTSSASTLHRDPQFDTAPVPAAGASAPALDAAAFAEAIAPGHPTGPEITRTRLLWYRAAPDERIDQAASTDDGGALQAAVPTLDLPDVPASIEPGVHYLCWEVLFTLAVPDHEHLHWRALVEVDTAAVLYLRALTASASGCVYAHDPITQAGSAAVCGSPVATLNALRTSLPSIDGLKPPVSGSQALDGDLVAVQDLFTPTVAPPIEAAPFSFCYDVTDSDFWAVNAYHHADFVFRWVEGMGIPLASYFDGTAFPVAVDHDGFSGVNAFANGNTTGTGLGSFRFGWVCAGGGIGIAADQRVVLHEFGHALLWDNVDSPNFGFAHSAGDALAAIVHDPGTQAPDRYLTFPWLTSMTGIDRRHDRDPDAGWAWFGAEWNTQYGGEQVLSTTLFRLYEALGGAPASDPDDQLWASRYTSFLIVKAIGTLTATTSDPEVFATALMEADLTETDFEGHPGGAVHKVVRWAFEQQGLFRPATTPRPWSGAGDPPAVDVYIDDGRGGGYAHQPDAVDSPDIWNRLAPDGGTTHETPLVGQTNHVYVRVGNRGTQAATDVSVRGFHCRADSALVWPDDWTALSTPQLAATGPIAPGDSTVLGPFAWTPDFVGHDCLLMLADATGDAANDANVAGPIARSRFVPFDNNIAQRDVAPVAGDG